MEFPSQLSLYLLSHASPSACTRTAAQPIAMVSISSKYARKLVLAEFRKRAWTLVPRSQVGSCSLQFAEYERIDFDAVFGPRQTRANCLCVRKGLTRKAALAQVLNQHMAKHPASLLAQCIPPTLVISTWDAFGDNGWLQKFNVYNPVIALEECLAEAKALLQPGPHPSSAKPSFVLKVRVERTASRPANPRPKPAVHCQQGR
jgi:hypothetical protein